MTPIKLLCISGEAAETQTSGIPSIMNILERIPVCDYNLIIDEYDYKDHRKQ